MLNIIVETRVAPISKNQAESKSPIPPLMRAPMIELYSSKLALTNRRRIPVLKNCTRKTPLVMSLVCSVSVGIPMYMINLIMMSLKM